MGGQFCINSEEWTICPVTCPKWTLPESLEIIFFIFQYLFTQKSFFKWQCTCKSSHFVTLSQEVCGCSNRSNHRVRHVHFMQFGMFECNEGWVWPFLCDYVFGSPVAMIEQHTYRVDWFLSYAVVDFVVPISLYILVVSTCANVFIPGGRRVKNQVFFFLAVLKI